jgi:hypothetical protein
MGFSTLVFLARLQKLFLRNSRSTAKIPPTGLVTKTARALPTVASRFFVVKNFAMLCEINN